MKNIIQQGRQTNIKSGAGKIVQKPFVVESQWFVIHIGIPAEFSRVIPQEMYFNLLAIFLKNKMKSRFEHIGKRIIYSTGGIYDRSEEHTSELQSRGLISYA